MPTLDDIASALGSSTNNTSVFEDPNTDDYAPESITMFVDEYDEIGGNYIQEANTVLRGRRVYRVRIFPDDTGQQYSDDINPSAATATASGDASAVQENGDIVWVSPANTTGSATITGSLNDGYNGSFSTSESFSVEEQIQIGAFASSTEDSITADVNIFGGDWNQITYYLDGNQKYSVTKSLSGTPLDYTYTGLSPSTTYTVKVEAMGTNGFVDVEEFDASTQNQPLQINPSGTELQTGVWTLNSGAYGGVTPYSYSWSADTGGTWSPSQTDGTPEFEPYITSQSFNVTCEVTDDTGVSKTETITLNGGDGTLK